MNQSQKEFEAWAEKLYGKANIELINGHYVKNSVAHDWYVWQAARAALVVELPEVLRDDYADDYTKARNEGAANILDDIKRALEAAGVKYK